MLSLAIDCRKIADGGIGTYIKNLLRCWKRQGAMAKFYLFHNSRDQLLIDEFRDFAEIVIHDYPKYSVSELFSFRKPLIEYNIDLFFCPHYTLPFNLPCPSVVTIYDLIHLRMPVKRGWLGRAYARFIMTKAIRNSKTVLTISEFSRNDIADLFPAHSSKVIPIYIGVDREIYRPLPKEDIEVFRLGNFLPDEFALYVGALKNHKNPGALAMVANELNIPMIVLTQDRGGFERLLTSVDNRGLVKMIQLDNEHEISLLYNSATLLFHPSLYEGFGLPPLEAMSCGLPVVCSNRTALPEVVGSSAVTFDPGSRGSMLSTLKSVWDNQGLRRQLSEMGIARSLNFKWDDTAMKTFEILKDAADR